MNDWLTTLLLGIALVAMVLGISSIIMGVITDKQGAEALKERIEYGFLGLASLVICGLIGYLLM